MRPRFYPNSYCKKSKFREELIVLDRKTIKLMERTLWLALFVCVLNTAITVMKIVGVF